MAKGLQICPFVFVETIFARGFKTALGGSALKYPMAQSWEI